VETSCWLLIDQNHRHHLCVLASFSRIVFCYLYNTNVKDLTFRWPWHSQLIFGTHLFSYHIFHIAYTLF